MGFEVKGQWWTKNKVNLDVHVDSKAMTRDNLEMFQWNWSRVSTFGVTMIVRIYTIG